MAGTGGLTDLATSVLGRARPRLPSGPVVVALSGGADSAVCAWVAVASGCTVRAVTVDHGLPASAGLVDAARSIATMLELDHAVVPVAPARGESALRTARYRALGDQCRHDEVVLTGHTADDQVETVLLNLVRGAGAHGLAGIPAERGRWRRPLLDVPRSDTRALAGALGLPFADDPDNADPSGLRVRLRTETIPSLEAASPGARAAIARAGRLAAQDEAALAAEAATIPVVRRGSEVAVPIGGLRAVPEAVAARVVRRMLRILLDPYAGTSADVTAVLRVAAGDAGRLPTGGGLVAAAEAGELVVYPAGEPPAPDRPVALTLGETVSWGGWSIAAAAASGDPIVGRWTADVAAGVLTGARVRAAVPGDRIDVGGGSKPVYEALREAGVPGRVRSRWPVVHGGGRMIWVPGARVAAGTGPSGPGDAIRLRAVEGPS